MAGSIHGAYRLIACHRWVGTEKVPNDQRNALSRWAAWPVRTGLPRLQGNTGSELPGYVVNVAGMFRMQCAASRSARTRFPASSPVNCWPTLKSLGERPVSARKPSLTKLNRPLSVGSWGKPLARSGLNARIQKSATRPSGRSTCRSSLPGRAKPPAPSAIRTSVLNNASLYVDDFWSLNTMCRSSGSAPVPSSGSRSQMTSHETSVRPPASGIRARRIVCRPWRRASSSTSATVAGSIGRSSGGGPRRRLNIMLAPGLITETSLRKARARTLRGTCIHTALTQTRSKVSFDRSTISSAGRVSFTHRMSGDWWRSCPAARNCADGSTATTLCPFAANQAASRPVPAPTSRMQPAHSGRRSRTGA